MRHLRHLRLPSLADACHTRPPRQLDSTANSREPASRQLAVTKVSSSSFAVAAGNRFAGSS